MLNISREELIHAIEKRHSVRDYNEMPIEQTKISAIREAMEKINTDFPQLSFRLVTDEPRAFGGRWASYGNFRGVSNYLVIAGERGNDVDVLCGQKGEELVLLLMHLGISTCWVGLTYKKIDTAFSLPPSASIRCVIAFGYANNPDGRQHKIKSPEQVSNITPRSPEWFKEGVRLALLAPTAVNQQKFFFELVDEKKVKATAKFSLVGYSRIDLGIAMTHFVIGANRPDIEIEIH